jgi:hypothetical protein
MTTGTRILLGCGMIAGPMFLVVALVQGLTRPGFDLAKHPFSLLSLGPGGWIQIANFVVTGLLFIAGAVGLRRCLRAGPGSTWGPLLYGLFGGALIAGGVFVSDPGAGYPPGAPEGRPVSVSWHGSLHGVAFVVGMASLIAVFVVFARWFAAQRDRMWARLSVVTGIAFVLLGGLGSGIGDWRLIGVGIAVGWCFASAVPARVFDRLQNFDRLQVGGAAEAPDTDRV